MISRNINCMVSVHFTSVRNRRLTKLQSSLKSSLYLLFNKKKNYISLLIPMVSELRCWDLAVPQHDGWLSSFWSPPSSLLVLGAYSSTNQLIPMPGTHRPSIQSHGDPVMPIGGPALAESPSEQSASCPGTQHCPPVDPEPGPAHQEVNTSP